MRAGWWWSCRPHRGRSSRTSRRARLAATARAPRGWRRNVSSRRRARARVSLERNLRFDGHPLLENALAVIDGDLDAVDELGAVFRRLNVARRELRLRRDVADLPRQAGTG